MASDTQEYYKYCKVLHCFAMKKRTHTHAAHQEQSESSKSLGKRQKTLEDRVRKLEEKGKAVSRETNDSTSQPEALGSDVLSLNVGGRRFDAFRNTLTSVEDSMLAAKFSGRWEDSFERDSEGRIFIDANPEYFAVLLDQLRSKMWDNGKLQSAVAPCLSDFGSKCKFAEFFRMVDYFGLIDAIFPLKVLEICPDTAQVCGRVSVTRTSRGVQMTTTQAKPLLVMKFASSCVDLVVSEITVESLRHVDIGLDGCVCMASPFGET